MEWLGEITEEDEKELLQIYKDSDGYGEDDYEDISNKVNELRKEYEQN